MTRIKRTIVRVFLIPTIITFGLLALLFATIPTTPHVRASDPTLDAAMQVIWQATHSAQQTRDARDAELASQRATAAAIENAQRQAALEATRSAYATRLIVEATATRQALDLQATRERQSAEATATRAALDAEATRQAIAATATMEALRAEEARTAATATAAMANLHAQATRTALARQQESEQRNALLTSFGIGASSLATLLAIIAIAYAIVNALRTLKAKPVVIVEEPRDSTPTPTPITQVVPFDENVARATLDLIAQQMNDDATNPESHSTE